MNYDLNIEHKLNKLNNGLNNYTFYSFCKKT